MPIRSIEEFDLKDKRVFIRVDFNCPVKNGVVTDDSRIQAALPTIRFAIEKGARLILASHLGRPKGSPDPKYTLRPVGSRLSELLGKEVVFPDDCVGDGVKRNVMDLRAGQVLLLENLRYHKEEEKNDEGFARQLAALCDIYINDAFGTAHRAHASTAGMAAFVQDKGVGFLMRREVEYLGRLLTSPDRPYVAALGGAKVSDKIAVMENLLNRVDTLIIGGGMAFTFLAAEGHRIGGSLFEADRLDNARDILRGAKARGVKVLLPTDVVGAFERGDAAPESTVAADAIPDGFIGLDIGPTTVEAFRGALLGAKTIFWNGPMGVFEEPRYAKGTFAVAHAVAESGALSVVGGGDSVAALNQAGLADKISHVSTGGGASLEFVQGLKLPGLTALE